MELHWLSILVITIMVSNSQTQSYYKRHPDPNSYQGGYPNVPYQVPGRNQGHHVQYPPLVGPYQIPGRHQGHHVQYPSLVGPYQIPGRHQGHHVQYPSLEGHNQLSSFDKSENSPLTGSKTNVDPMKVHQLYKALREQQEDVNKVKTVMLSLKNALTPLMTLLQDIGDDNNEGVSFIHGK